MNNLVKTNNWFDEFNYNEEIKSLTQEIEGFGARIYAKSEGKEDLVNINEIDAIVKNTLKGRDDLMSGNIVLETEDKAKKYTESLDKYWHLLKNIENQL